jgi:hypothetical protein
MTASHWLRRPVWATLILLGVAGTVYQMAYLRFETLLADHGLVPRYFSPDRQLGKRTYALRSAYEQLRRQLPSNAIIQNNPEWKYPDYFFGLYSESQTAAFDPECGTEFGGSLATCRQFYPKINSVFAAGTDQNVTDVDQLSKQLRLSAVLVKDLDPSWKDRRSWPWQVSPAFANDYVRVYVFPLPDTGRINQAGLQVRIAHP